VKLTSQLFRSQIFNAVSVLSLIFVQEQKLTAQLDTLRFPSVWIDNNPFQTIFNGMANLGFNFGIKQKYAVGIGLVQYHDWWNKNYHENQNYWGYSLRFRHRYSRMHSIAQYGIAEFNSVYNTFNQQFQFQSGSTQWNKTILISERFQSLSYGFGLFGTGKRNRFPLEVSLGLGFGIRKVQYLGLTDFENRYIMEHPGMQPPQFEPGRKNKVILAGGFRFGVILFR